MCFTGEVEGATIADHTHLDQGHTHADAGHTHNDKGHSHGDKAHQHEIESSSDGLRIALIRPFLHLKFF